MALDIYQNNHVNVSRFKKMLATNDPNRLAEALGKRQSASAQPYGQPGGRQLYNYAGGSLQESGYFSDHAGDDSDSSTDGDDEHYLGSGVGGAASMNGIRGSVPLREPEENDAFGHHDDEMFLQQKQQRRLEEEEMMFEQQERQRQQQQEEQMLFEQQQDIFEPQVTAEFYDYDDKPQPMTRNGIGGLKNGPTSGSGSGRMSPGSGGGRNPTNGSGRTNPDGGMSAPVSGSGMSPPMSGGGIYSAGSGRSPPRGSFNYTAGVGGANGGGGASPSTGSVVGTPPGGANQHQQLNDPYYDEFQQQQQMQQDQHYDDYHQQQQQQHQHHQHDDRLHDDGYRDQYREPQYREEAMQQQQQQRRQSATPMRPRGMSLASRNSSSSGASSSTQYSSTSASSASSGASMGRSRSKSHSASSGGNGTRSASRSRSKGPMGPMAAVNTGSSNASNSRWIRAPIEPQFQLSRTVKSGWLSKKGPTDASAWKKRYFVLSEDGILRYYARDPAISPNEQPKGTIDLRLISRVSTAQSVLRSWIFMLHPKDPAWRTYKISAKQRDTLWEWVNQINDIIRPAGPSS